MLPSPSLQNSSPFLLLHKTAPDFQGLRVFDFRSFQCVYLGASPAHKWSICYHIPTKRTYISKVIKFDETCFPFAQTNASQPTSSTEPTYSFIHSPSLSSYGPLLAYPIHFRPTTIVIFLFYLVCSSHVYTSCSALCLFNHDTFTYRLSPPTLVHRRHHHLASTPSSYHHQIRYSRNPNLLLHCSEIPRMAQCHVHRV